MNTPPADALCASVFVTTTSRAPAEPAGDVQVIDVDDTTDTDVHAAPPTVTVAPAKKPVPVIVSWVPPATGPEEDDTEVIVGAGFGMLSAIT